MNIFYLHPDPVTCAQQHVDKHVVKMILEYAQLMSTAHRLLDGVETIGLSKSGRKQKRFALPDHRDTILYSATHANHPSAIWTRRSKQNYQWLYDMWCQLMNEYTYRYGKQHACEKLKQALAMAPRNIPDSVFTEPTPAMPDQYKVVGDSVTSYKNYYLGSKSAMFSWKKRETPGWVINSQNPIHQGTAA